MTWRNLLLRAYPRSWRDEYGEALVAVLAHQRPTPGVVADVLSNGAKQHFYGDDPYCRGTFWQTLCTVRKGMRA
jgi:hypothetical protein